MLIGSRRFFAFTLKTVFDSGVEIPAQLITQVLVQARTKMLVEILVQLKLML